MTAVTIRWTVLKTPLGLFAIARGAQGLVAAWFVEGVPPANVLGERWPKAEIMRDDKSLAPARRQMEQYFAGKRRAFEIPLDLGGTEWQRAVWREVCAIPFGETRTYRDVARAVGKPQAVRAVGAANGQNAVCIVVPCHRLIGSDGSLHGYGGGLDRKRALLDLESRVTVASARSARARSRGPRPSR